MHLVALICAQNSFPEDALLAHVAEVYPSVDWSAESPSFVHEFNVFRNSAPSDTVIASGPQELEPLAEWVRGVDANEEVGILVQHLLDQLFFSQFLATEQSWEAAKVLVAGRTLQKLTQDGMVVSSGKVRRAKRLLARMVQ